MVYRTLKGTNKARQSADPGTEKPRKSLKSLRRFSDFLVVQLPNHRRVTSVPNLKGMVVMPYHRTLKGTNKARQSADPGTGKPRKSLKSLKISTAELALNGSLKKKEGQFRREV